MPRLTILERAAGAPDSPTILSELEKSVKGVGQATGLYKAETPEEKAELEQRFKADVGSTLVGGAVGAIATPLLGPAGPFLGTMASGALAGAAGGATYAAIEEDPIGPATIGGALLGAAFGAFAGRVREGISMGQEAFGATVEKTTSAVKAAVAERVAKIRRPDLSYSTTVAGDPRTIKQLFSGVTGSMLDDGVGEVRVKPSRAATVALANAELPTGVIRREARKLAREGLAATGEPEAGLDHPGVPMHFLQRVSDEVALKAEEIGAASVVRDLSALSDRVLRSARGALSKMGNTGAYFAKLLDQSYDQAQLKAGERVLAVEGVFKGMNKKQRIRIGDILRGEEVPSTPEERRAVGELRELLDTIAVEASDAELREFDPRTRTVKAFEYRKNYYPLVYDRKTMIKLTKPGPEREAAIEWLLKHDQAVNRHEAEELLKRFVNTPTEFRQGNLQLVRNYSLPGFERDPLVSLPRYFWRAQRRIEMANIFGAQDEVAEAMFVNLANEGFDAPLAQEIYRAAADKAPRQFSSLLKATRTFNILTLLWTAGIVQPAQLSNTVAWVGYKNMLRGLSVLFNKHGRNWAEGTGASLSETIQAIIPESEGGWSSRWLDWIQLTRLDQANRLVSAMAGRFHAQETALKFFGNPAKKNLANDLVRMGLVPDEVLAAGGRLTNEQLRTAALAVANNTQFRSSVMDLPIFKQTPLGDFMLLFKSFAIQQLNFVGDLVSQARKGNRAPLIRYMTALGVINYSVGELLSLVKQRPQEEGAWHYINAVGSAGALGVLYDALTSMEAGPQRVASFIGGPTAGQLYEFIGHDVRNIAFEGDPKPLIRDAIKHIPGIGRYLAPAFVPAE